jgi:hypothetical protein
MPLRLYRDKGNKREEKIIGYSSEADSDYVALLNLPSRPATKMVRAPMPNRAGEHSARALFSFTSLAQLPLDAPIGTMSKEGGLVAYVFAIVCSQMPAPVCMLSTRGDGRQAGRGFDDDLELRRGLRRLVVTWYR